MKSERSPKAGRPPAKPRVAPRTSRGVPRAVESRLAPPKYTERQHAKPGSGIKRSRGVMQPRSR